MLQSFSGVGVAIAWQCIQVSEVQAGDSSHSHAGTSGISVHHRDHDRLCKQGKASFTIRRQVTSLHWPRSNEKAELLPVYPARTCARHCLTIRHAIDTPKYCWVGGLPTFWRPTPCTYNSTCCPTQNGASVQCCPNRPVSKTCPGTGKIVSTLTDGSTKATQMSPQSIALRSPLRVCSVSAAGWQAQAHAGTRNSLQQAGPKAPENLELHV